MANIFKAVGAFSPGLFTRGQELSMLGDLPDDNLVLLKKGKVTGGSWHAVPARTIPVHLFADANSAVLQKRIARILSGVEAPVVASPVCIVDVTGRSRKRREGAYVVRLPNGEEVELAVSTAGLLELIGDLDLAAGGKQYQVQWDTADLQAARQARPVPIGMDALAPLPIVQFGRKVGRAGYQISLPSVPGIELVTGLAVIREEGRIAQVDIGLAKGFALSRGPQANNSGGGLSAIGSSGRKAGGGDGGSGAGGGGDSGDGGGGGPPSDRAFPCIEPSELSVVQRADFTVDVTLSPEQIEHTRGTAVALEPGELTFEVHLLLDDQEGWQELVYKNPGGTTKPARFSFKAPKIGAGATHVPPDVMEATLVANFYLAKRWCGEARRNIEVRRNKEVTPSAGFDGRIDDEDWEDRLQIAPGAEAPDLLVRIHICPKEGSYRFALLSPHANFRAPRWRKDNTVTIPEKPASFVTDNFGALEGVKLTRPDAGTIRSACRAIYRSTPLSFQRAYWHLHALAARFGSRARLETILFISDEAYVPWELMMLQDPQEQENEEILAIRHSVGRWSTGQGPAPAPEIVLTKMQVFASDYKNDVEEEKLPWVAEERAHLAAKYRAESRPLRLKAITTLLNDGGAQAVHFSCHGELSSDQPAASRLRLEKAEELRISDLEDPAVRKGLGRDRPFVFLNACQVGGTGLQLAVVKGWPLAFLGIGASACLAPIWSVMDETARHVAESFYKEVLGKGRSLGEVLREIRAEWAKQGNLTYLSYTLYGDPTTRIRWKKD